MTKTEREWQKYVEDLKAITKMWEYRASFWVSVAAYCAAQDEYGAEMEQQPGERLGDIVADFVRREASLGGFRGDEEAAGEDGEIEKTIPWPAVLTILAEINIDGNAILVEYVEGGQQALQNAIELLGRQHYPNTTAFFAGEPITHEIADGIIKDLFGEDFERKFAGKYVLHVTHGDRPCRHPYDSIDEAIEGAALDLHGGVITSVGALSHDGALVLTEGEVRNRVDQIHKAGLN